MKTNDIVEGLGVAAHSMEQEHELQRARAKVFNIANDSIKLHKLLKHMNEANGVDEGVLARITTAADYVREVVQHLESHGVTPTLFAEDASVGAVASGAVATVAKPIGKKKPRRR